MVPATKPVILALTAVSVFPLSGDWLATTFVPYEVVRPYSKETVVLLELALTVPFRVALLLVSEVAATVSALGHAGEATTPENVHPRTQAECAAEISLHLQAMMWSQRLPRRH